MSLGYTVEGFPIHAGSTYYIPLLAEIEQPTFKKHTPTPDNPDAITDGKMPSKWAYVPEQICVTASPDQPVWQRYKDCHTHCEQLNRGKK